MFRTNGLCKILLSVLGFSFFIKTASGQFTYGLKGGVSYSYTLVDGSATPYTCGFLAGITTDINLGKHFFISPQLYYSQKGYTMPFTGTYRINYLNLPVLCGYRITSHLQVLLGFNLGIKLNDKIIKGDTLSITTFSLQRIDPGINAGLRYQLDRWGVDFSFVRSLIGIEKTEQTFYFYNFLGMGYPQSEANLPESEKSKNISFEVSIYYLFGGK
jgi:Outer membrane protein beta-barrel domain